MGSNQASPDSFVRPSRMGVERSRTIIEEIEINETNEVNFSGETPKKDYARTI